MIDLESFCEERITIWEMGMAFGEQNVNSSGSESVMLECSRRDVAGFL